MSDDPQTILVSGDNLAVLKELLGKARQIASRLGWKVAALPLDPAIALDPKVFGEAGADLLYRLEGGLQLEDNPEVNVAILSALVRQVQPKLVLLGATKQGMEVAPRVAERTGAGYGAWATEVDVDPSTCLAAASCVLYTGLGLGSYQFHTPTTLLTVAPGVFKLQSPESREAALKPFEAPLIAPKMKVVEYQPKGKGSSRIEEARTVVDVGQGVKQREDLSLVETVAGLLDGQLACSRPVASDRDWFPEWLGLSGKKVSPELCLAIGISGAVQHIIGIRDSRVIVAVNNDENAGVFSQVDYGVVADLYAFLPALVERLQARKVAPVWKH